ncbi:hypothetical protein L5515_015494 [Caenorhabditis briggsae]|uniref:Uncharacterized protein n=1 Tax=Caenorhabditis briggsae TaxID=6238 RepID=A0AAE9EFB4_CAEBR|nr:hypothetical protein L5515_015494 [Caenorhabditis briggsae]
MNEGVISSSIFCTPDNLQQLLDLLKSVAPTSEFPVLPVSGLVSDNIGSSTLGTLGAITSPFPVARFSGSMSSNLSPVPQEVKKTRRPKKAISPLELGGTPDFQTMKELFSYRSFRTKYHKSMIIAPPVLFGSREYIQRWVEACERARTSPIYHDEKIVCRTSLFDPKRLDAIPQKVVNPVDAAMMYKQWRLEDNVHIDEAKKEWKELSKDFDFYKEWAKRASDLFTEHVKQKEGYIVVMVNESSKRKRLQGVSKRLQIL